MAGRRLTIEVGFDLVCPWCLIGKRQLEKAMQLLAQQRPDVEVVLHWRSVQLLPQIVSPGVPFKPFYIHRLGSAEAVGMRQAQVRLAGAAEGLNFDFERIEVMPNTLAAHRWIAYTAQHADLATVERLIERLFKAHFLKGENIGDAAVLDRIGVEQQMARGEAELAPFAAMQGVPSFNFNGRIHLSGAQGVHRLLAAMTACLAETEALAAEFPA